MNESAAMLAVLPGNARVRRFALEAIQRQTARSARGMSDYVSDSQSIVQLQAVWLNAVPIGDAGTAATALLNASNFASNSQGDMTVPDGTSSVLGAIAGDAATCGNMATQGDLSFASSGTYSDLNANVAKLVSPDSGNAAGLATQQALLVQAIQGQPGLADQLIAGGWDSTTILGAICTPCGVIWPKATVRDAVTALGGVTSAAGLTTPQSGADAQAKHNVQIAVSNASAAARKAACALVPGATWDDTTGCTLPDPTAALKKILIAAALGLVAIGTGYVVLKGYFTGKGMRANPRRKPTRVYVAKRRAA